MGYLSNKLLLTSSLAIIVLFSLTAKCHEEQLKKTYNTQYDPCIERCNFHRPLGDHLPYQVTCDALQNDADKAACKADCNYCPSTIPSICDSSQEPIIFNCPSNNELYFGRCKLRCDYQRPINIPTDSFEFFCYNYTLFPTTWDVRQCTNDCEKCDPRICHFLDSIFKCPSIREPLSVRPPPPPSEPLYEGSTCEWRCDHERPDDKNLTESYVLSCRNAYPGTDSEIQACQEDCKKCNLDVCDAQYDPDTFFCPPSNRSSLKNQLMPQRGGSYILSWIVIASIAVAILGCIMGAACYGKNKSGACASCECRHCCRKNRLQVEPETSTLVENEIK